MVPRRAPIRFENIPDDVCRGSGNEWRVTGFFWDLIDRHDDGETSAYSFADTWNILLNSRVRSAEDAAEKLRRGGMNAEHINTAWQLNF